MKRTLLSLIIIMTALCGKQTAAWAQTELAVGTDEAKANAQTRMLADVAIDSVAMERNGSYLSVSMLMDLSGMHVMRNRAVLLTPRLVNGTDSIELPGIGVYGRRRYYYYVRNGESSLSGKKDELIFRASHKPSRLDYNRLVDYQKWMNGSDLCLRVEEFGCCNTLLWQQDGTLGRHTEKFFPELVYVTPQAEREKSFSLEGSAYIDFPVNQTTIYPDYHNNTAELGKIEATIDSVRNDKDITITSVWLKGYASPEGTYSHNIDLAKGRTAALESHIKQMYNFPDTILSTAYEPEDWEGLRRYVEASTLEHRGEILDLIDNSPLEPDAKERKIKSAYPKDYRYLLDNCYPALRHTDYRVAYTIRSYSDIEEIKQLLQTQPQKLGLNEMYLVAQEYEPGTDEFTEVFETAVRLFPDDETANLNAANAAMRRDDLKAAERYLQKAGDTAEAVYARGAFAIRSERYDEAKVYLKQAAAMGLEQASVTLEQLEKGRRK